MAHRQCTARRNVDGMWLEMVAFWQPSLAALSAQTHANAISSPFSAFCFQARSQRARNAHLIISGLSSANSFADNGVGCVRVPGAGRSISGPGDHLPTNSSSDAGSWHVLAQMGELLEMLSEFYFSQYNKSEQKN